MAVSVAKQAVLRAAFALVLCGQFGLAFKIVPADVPTILSSALKAADGEAGSTTIQAEALKDCLTEASSTNFIANVFAGIDMLMQQRGKKVRRGLFHIASASLSLVADAEAKCGADTVKGSMLTADAKRLKDLTEKKGNVEYKVKERLVVGGIDIHKPLNLFIGGWKNYVRAEEAGEKLGETLSAFKERAEKDAGVKTEL
eukprot:TRINITY_DN13373_c0_g1_i1.p1 TRINITY_DN13373_c0_g1~~TRINITY_DN13373_c0_g1_i1.p1  ORF type:complete len:216 (+),score=53.48 TRINITY_DN13373_c0_g1_i1:50-649(+)